MRPQLLFEVEREHHKYYVQSTYVHDSGSVKNQGAFEHRPKHSGQITLECIPVIPDENGVANEKCSVDNYQISQHYNERSTKYRTGLFFCHFSGLFYIYQRILCLRSLMCSCRPRNRTQFRNLSACSSLPLKGCPDSHGICCFCRNRREHPH